MSTALYIVAEAEMDEQELQVDGKSIAQLDESILEELCDELGVPSLYSFVSASDDDIANVLDDYDFDDIPDVVSEGEQWFDAKDGLEVVTRLIEHLEENPDAVSDADAILDDLRQYESVLATLDAHQVRWHFSYDY